MLFNVHNGQMRFTAADKGSKPIFRDKMKVGHMSIGHIKDLQGNITHRGGYKSDKLGNIDVAIHYHLDTMIGQGWPIYNGDGKTYPVPKDDLIYPNMNLSSTYWQRINEAKNLRRD